MGRCMVLDVWYQTAWEIRILAERASDVC